MWVLKKLAHISLTLIVLFWAYEHLTRSYSYAKYFIYIVDQLQYSWLNVKIIHFSELQAIFLSKLLAIEQGFIVFLIVFNNRNAYILLLINLIAFGSLFYGQDILNFRMRYWQSQQKIQFFNMLAISGIALMLYGDIPINKRQSK